MNAAACWLLASPRSYGAAQVSWSASCQGQPPRSLRWPSLGSCVRELADSPAHDPVGPGGPPDREQGRLVWGRRKPQLRRVPLGCHRATQLHGLRGQGDAGYTTKHLEPGSVAGSGGDLFGEWDTDSGQRVHSRLTWSRITRSSAHWESHRSLDGGKTWTTHWVIDFTRREAKQ